MDAKVWTPAELGDYVKENRLSFGDSSWGCGETRDGTVVDEVVTLSGRGTITVRWYPDEAQWDDADGDLDELPWDDIRCIATDVDIEGWTLEE